MQEKGEVVRFPDQAHAADADGIDTQRITPWNVTYRADWSPDGEWLAFDFDVSGTGLPRDLYVVHPDGTGRADHVERGREDVLRPDVVAR
jgi:hypothetical protein